MSTECDYDRTQFEEYAAELAGSSRDLAMRPAIEEMVRQFFRAFNKGKEDIMMSFFNDNPTVITGLKKAGNIWSGTADLKTWVEMWHKNMEQYVPKMIIVDRGRVVCHLVIFWLDDEDFEDFTEGHEVIIMDLDEDNRIKRLEYRGTTREDKEHEGGRELLDKLIEEAEKDTISVDYLY